MRRTISELEKEGYEGVDASLSISLFEYGMIWKQTPEEYEFIFGIKTVDGYYSEFRICTFPVNTDPEEEFNWVEWDDVCSWAGCGMDLFKESFTDCVNSLFRYYGYNCVFGESYEGGFEVADV